MFGPFSQRTSCRVMTFRPGDLPYLPDRGRPCATRCPQGRNPKVVFRCTTMCRVATVLRWVQFPGRQCTLPLSLPKRVCAVISIRLTDQGTRPRFCEGWTRILGRGQARGLVGAFWRALRKFTSQFLNLFRSLGVHNFFLNGLAYLASQDVKIRLLSYAPVMVSSPVSQSLGASPHRCPATLIFRCHEKTSIRLKSKCGKN